MIKKNLSLFMTTVFVFSFIMILLSTCQNPGGGIGGGGARAGAISPPVTAPRPAAAPKPIAAAPKPVAMPAKPVVKPDPHESVGDAAWGGGKTADIHIDLDAKDFGKF
jgi:hypothetical protein